MASFVERRKPIWRAAIILAVMFGGAVFVAVFFGGVPTWQKHGANAGPGLVWRETDPWMYYPLTVAYTATAAVSLFFAFFRFPWATIIHIRLLFLAVFVLLLGQLLYSLALPMPQERAQAAWKRIEALGGHGVWESDMVVVSLAGTGVTDNDLMLFADFRAVQILDLSNNPLTDDCLRYLNHLEALDSLVLVGTKVSPAAVEQFKSTHPTVDVRIEAMPKDTINPFTESKRGSERF